MKKLLPLLFLFLTNVCFSQANAKKIVGKWATCAKIETLIKLDTVSFVKDEIGFTNACIEKNCAYSRWTFEMNGSDGKIGFYRQAGCKDAASVSEKNFEGTWALEKDKKTLTVFDDHFTKHTFEITLLSATEMKLKRVK